MEKVRCKKVVRLARSPRRFFDDQDKRDTVMISVAGFTERRFDMALLLRPNLFEQTNVDLDYRIIHS